MPLQKNNMKNFLKKPFQWVVGIGLLAFIISKLNLKIIIDDIDNLNWFLLIGVLVLKFSIRVLCSYKWFVLVKITNKVLTFGQTLFMHLFGGAVGLVVPFVGSDIAVGYSYYKMSGKAEDSISSIMVDRAIGLYTTILLAVMGLIFSFNLFTDIQYVFYVIAVVVIIAVFSTITGIYLVLNPEYLAKLWIPKKLKPVLKNVRSIFKQYLVHHKSVLIYNCFLSFIVQTLRVFSTYLLAISIGAEASIIFFMCVVPLIFLLIQLPISASGFGVEEGAYIILFGLIGISAESAFTMSMIGRVLTIITTIPGAIWCIFWWNLKKDENKISENDRVAVLEN